MTETVPTVPDEIARTVVLPESHRDEGAVHRAHAWLRANMPIGLADVEGYDPIWLVARHEDVADIERRAEVFHNGDFNQILRSQASDRFQKDVLGNGSIRVLNSLSSMDAPEHRNLRAVSAEWFMPRNIRTFKAQMHRDAAEAVERLMDFDGEVDFVQEFALLYPLRVIMTLIGVPREDEPLMLKLTQEFFGTTEPDPDAPAVTPDPAALAKQWHAAITRFFDYFDALIEERRARPTGDYASLLAAATIDGEPLPRKYRNAFCVSIAAAGHDTTSSSISGGLLGLIRHPDQLAKATADPTLAGSLTDESIRYVTPVKHFMRSATRPAEVRGQAIGEGERLMLLYGSANRDENVFSHPDAFDVTRSPNKHLAFGFGPHMCIGLHVAKLEMEVLWEQLLPRLTSAELAGEPRFVASNWVGGLKSLPIRFQKA